MLPAIMAAVKPVRIGSFSVGGGSPLAFILGTCVIESAAHALETAAAIREDRRAMRRPVIFKASYDKDNRTSMKSFRGRGSMPASASSRTCARARDCRC